MLIKPHDYGCTCERCAGMVAAILACNSDGSYFFSDQELAQMALTDDYKLALEKHNQAIQVFTAARTAYRNRTISDQEFLTAKATYNKATAEFDIAFAKEQNRS